MADTAKKAAAKKAAAAPKNEPEDVVVVQGNAHPHAGTEDEVFAYTPPEGDEK